MAFSTNNLSNRGIMGPYTDYNQAKQALDQHNAERINIVSRQFQEAIQNNQSCSGSTGAVSIRMDGGKYYVVPPEALSGDTQQNSVVPVTTISPSKCPETLQSSIRASSLPSSVPNPRERLNQQPQPVTILGGRTLKLTENTDKVTCHLEVKEPTLIKFQDGSFAARGLGYHGEVIAHPHPPSVLVAMYKKIYSTISFICSFIYGLLQSLGKQLKKVFG